MRRFAPLALAALVAAAVAGPARAGDDGPRFRAYALIVDHAAPLAAWQVEITVAKGHAEIVGVEGGDAPFADPPFYDPKALSGGRIVLAAYTTAAPLAPGASRVAVVHLYETGTPTLNVHVVVAGDASGRRIEATASLRPLAAPPAPSKGSTP